MLGVLYGAMGLVFLPFILLMSFISMMLPHGAGDPPKGIGIAVGLGLAIAMPIMYAAMGFILGVITAWLYNLTAKWIGGIEVEVE